MGDVEISISEEGVLKVRQHYDLRNLLRRSGPEGFERRRAVKWPNCSDVSKRVRDVKFNRVLGIFLIITIILALINLFFLEQLLIRSDPLTEAEASSWNYIFNQTWLFGHFEIGRKGILLLAIFAAILTVGVFTKNVTKNISSAPRRKEEVQTVSALVQQV